MITAVDTSVLFDVFLMQPDFAEASSAALREADAAGSLVICDIVYAELASRFPRQQMLDNALAKLDIRLEVLNAADCFEAGRAFRAYRASGGPRERILPDFLIGAHAVNGASRLLTRDRGFYRAHFSKLKIYAPSAA